MAISMYSASVSQFKKMLGNLAKIMKTEEECGAVGRAEYLCG
jgi:hypothetical protein